MRRRRKRKARANESNVEKTTREREKMRKVK